MKLFVNDTEFTAIGFGAAKTDSGTGADTLILKFNSSKALNDIITFFKALPDSTIIKTSDTTKDGEELGEAFTDFVSVKDNVQVKVNDDNTYDYTVYLGKKSALDIAKQAAANVEYLAVVSGVELN